MGDSGLSYIQHLRSWATRPSSSLGQRRSWILLWPATPWTSPSCFAAWLLLGVGSSRCGGSSYFSGQMRIYNRSRWVFGAQVWQAGVRKGCLLSPHLYMFVVEAVACWLGRFSTMGVTVVRKRIVSGTLPIVPRPSVGATAGPCAAPGHALRCVYLLLDQLVVLMWQQGRAHSRSWPPGNDWASPASLLPPSLVGLLGVRGCADSNAEHSAAPTPACRGAPP
jgi:hypothetical protein